MPMSVSLRSPHLCDGARIVGVMNAEQFEATRREVSASEPASDGGNPLGMEMDFCAYLGDPASADEDPGLWHGLAVTRTEGAE